MSIPSEEPTMHELLSRLAELEQAHARLQEDLIHARGERGPVTEEPARSQARSHPGRSSRRKALRKGLGVAVAALGAGALLEVGSGSALASGPGSFSSSISTTPAVKATGTKGAKGVVASSDTSTGVSTTSKSGPGLYAQSTSGLGAHIVGGGASSTTPSFTEAAIFAEGGPGYGLYASSASSVDAVYAKNSSGNAMHAVNTTAGTSGLFAEGGAGYGVYATSTSGTSISSTSNSGTGLYASGSTGVYGSTNAGTGVYGNSNSGTAVYAQSTSGLAGHFVGNVSMDNNLTVTGTLNSGTLSTGTLTSGAGSLASSVSGTPAVKATGTNGADGIDASSDSGSAVSATSSSGTALIAKSSSGLAGHFVGSVTVDLDLTVGNVVNTGPVTATGLTVNGPATISSDLRSGPGSFGSSNASFAAVSAGGTNGANGIYASSDTGLAGDFQGNVSVTGTLSKGGGSFKIDHPLDPAHKYLSHSFVESPDMKNIYDGVVTLDANGEAEVTLPTWFDTLNSDFRYQLTAIGVAAPDLYIAEKISTGRFKIAGGKPGMEVSWMVTGIRQDAWANAHRIPVEQDKPVEEQGYYLHPDLHGQAEEKSIYYACYPHGKSPAPART